MAYILTLVFEHHSGIVRRYNIMEHSWSQDLPVVLTFSGLAVVVAALLYGMFTDSKFLLFK